MAYVENAKFRKGLICKIHTEYDIFGIIVE